MQHGPDQPKKEVPTLQDFAARFLDGHSRANRQKPSGIAAKEMLLRIYLLPFFGHRRLNAITNEDVQRLKASMVVKAPKTVNNVLSLLGVMLKKAVEWDVIDRMPCAVRLLRVVKGTAGFHDFSEYERLVEAAAADKETKLIVLLGGEAGLRCGEIIALEWRDVDLKNRQLATALREHRHLHGARVLCPSVSEPLTRQQVQYRLKRAAEQAGVRQGVHLLRHTFCSHLAMRGAPSKAIQELAGHQDLSTTQQYMHLTPAALEAAIRLLDSPPMPSSRGDILETGS